MACNSRGPFQGKLEDCGRGASQQVGPVNGIDVVGLGEFLARVSLPCQATMVRVVQLDDQPPDCLTTLLHIYQDSSAAISQPIQCVNIMDHNYLTAHLHRESKGPKMVFSGGRRQKLSFLSQTFCIRSHLSHHIRIHLNKLQVQFKFKTTFTFF